MDDVGGRKQGPLGVLEARALRQVEHDRQLRLVVEREQLHGHLLQVEQRTHRDGGEADREQEYPGVAPRAQDRRRDPAVDAPERALLVRGCRAARQMRPRREPQHQPGRDYDRDEKREQHGGGGVGRDRRHVGPHQARDEQHRQERGHHRQGRHDGRVADLGDRLDRGLQAWPAVRHRPVAGDVLHHDDGVVDQNADREDEREQADPVDGVAHQVGGEQREQDRGRNHHQGDHRLAPPDRHRDEADDRHGREAEMQQQLVRLLVGGLAIVAADGDVDVGRNEPPLERIEPIEHLRGHHHGVGAGALGERQADGRSPGPGPTIAARIAPYPVLERARADDDAGDVANIDRASVPRGDEQQPDVGDSDRASARPRPCACCRHRAPSRPGTNGWRPAPWRSAAPA